MNFWQTCYERHTVKLTFRLPIYHSLKVDFHCRVFYALTRLKFTPANKIEVMHGSTFTFTRDTSYIVSFICAHKFQGRTYVEITRQWKSTISLVFMNVKNYPRIQYVNVVNGGKMFTCLRFLP